MPTQSGSQALAGELPAIHGTTICPTHYNVSCEHWNRWRAPYSHLQSPAFSWVLLSLLLIQVSACFSFSWDFPGGSEVKASACNAGDLGSIPELGRFPWRRKWQPTPVLSPGKSHGQRSLVATVHGVTKSWTRLSDLHFTIKGYPGNPVRGKRIGKDDLY